MESELIFDAEKHFYFYKGKRVPSVTQVLDPLVDYNSVPADIMARAQQYGNNLHEAIKLNMAGQLDHDSLDENLKGPVEEFFKWFDRTFPGLTKSNDLNGKPLCSWRLKYAGTPDIIVPILLEIKTRRVEHYVDDLQCYAYEHLLQNGGTKTYDRLLVELLPGQPLKVYPVKNKAAWGAFRKLLDDWWHKQEMQEWIERWKRQ